MTVNSYKDLEGMQMHMPVPMSQVQRTCRARIQHNGAFFHACYLDLFDITVVVVQSILHSECHKQGTVVLVREGSDYIRALMAATKSFPQLGERSLMLCQNNQ